MSKENHQGSQLDCDCPDGFYIHTVLAYTILVLNDDKDAARRIAKGDRKALCSPPQRRNPFAIYTNMTIETDLY